MEAHNKKREEKLKLRTLPRPREIITVREDSSGIFFSGRWLICLGGISFTSLRDNNVSEILSRLGVIGIKGLF
jgi:hypothetical protein